MIKTDHREIFICHACNYKTDRKFNYMKHLKSSKHLTLHKDIDNDLGKYKCECGNVYKFSSGLRRHKTKCLFNKNKEFKSESKSEKEEKLEKIMIEQMSCIKKQQEQIGELIPKIGNNNQLNINVFLNEKCKDAVCIKDFIASLQVELADLDLSRKKGLSYSIANMMVSGLKQLNVNERPIHCMDKHREILYVKDEEAWEEDKNNSLINKSIEKMAEKQRRSINKWIEAHPNWKSSEDESKEYMEMVENLMKDVDENNYIFNSIASETEL